MQREGPKCRTFRGRAQVQIQVFNQRLAVRQTTQKESRQRGRVHKNISESHTQREEQKIQETASLSLSTYYWISLAYCLLSSSHPVMLHDFIKHDQTQLWQMAGRTDSFVYSLKHHALSPAVTALCESLNFVSPTNPIKTTFMRCRRLSCLMTPVSPWPWRGRRISIVTFSQELNSC